MNQWKLEERRDCNTCETNEYCNKINGPGTKFCSLTKYALKLPDLGRDRPFFIPLRVFKSRRF